MNRLTVKGKKARKMAKVNLELRHAKSYTDKVQSVIGNWIKTDYFDESDTLFNNIVEEFIKKNGLLCADDFQGETHLSEENRKRFDKKYAKELSASLVYNLYKRHVFNEDKVGFFMSQIKTRWLYTALDITFLQTVIDVYESS